MVFRQLTQEKYEYFIQQLIERARQEPLDASFSVTMTINNAEYLLKIQPEKHCKIYILQALKVERDEYGHLHELITDNQFLLSLLEILIRQGVR